MVPITEENDDARRDGTSIEVLYLSPVEPAETPFGPWMVRETVRTIGWLRDRLVPQPRLTVKAVVVLAFPQAADVWHAAAANALFQSLRGVVGSLTLERGPGLRLNMIVADGFDDPDVRVTLNFLASDAAGFIAGSTFDLREPS